MAKTVRYFLGANSPQGPVSRFDQLGEAGARRCWVVTGGSARGRAWVLSQAGEALGEEEPREEILSLQNGRELAGVLFPRRGLSAAGEEGAWEPWLRCPGALERVVSLWDCLDQERLFDQKKDLLQLTEEEKNLRGDARGYLYAAGALMGELASVGNSAMDREKLLGYARRLALREFPRPKGEGKRGRESVRFLSALTGEGPVLLRKTVALAAPRTIAIEDSWGAVSNALLEALRELALEAGVDVVSCRCPLFPFTKLEYLLLPGLKLGFFAKNPGNAKQLEGLAERTIHASRFSRMDLLRERRGRSSFLRKAAAGMLDQAAEVLGRAEQVRQEKDALCHAAMDQDALEEIARRTAAEIKKAALE